MTMIERQRKTRQPCPGCCLHLSLCLCDQIPKLDLKTRVSLVIHHRELKRTTNTGRLALKALSNSKMFVRGEETAPLDLSDCLTSDFQPLLFFPSEESRELTPELLQEFSKPIHLIVPDGSWRQASKVQTRHPELKNIPRVMIRTPNTETQFLRKESSPEGMATLQAIAIALGIIEGTIVGDQLMALYRLKLHRTMIGRGHTHAPSSMTVTKLTSV